MKAARLLESGQLLLSLCEFHWRCYSFVTGHEMGNFHIFDAVHQQHNMEVRDETNDQLNSYFLWHFRFSDHGLFPSHPDRHAAAATQSAKFE